MTLEAVKPIKLMNVDTDNLQDVEDIPEAVQFAVVLSDEPSSIWVQEFGTAYGMLHHPIKPPFDVVKDRLWVSFLPRYASDLQAYVDFLKAVVDRANVEEKRTLQMHEHDNAADKTRLRDMLKRLRI